MTEWMKTADFAAALQLRPNTLRRALSEKGSYYGVIPVKTWNGRLRWPADAIAKLQPTTQENHDEPQ